MTDRKETFSDVMLLVDDHYLADRANVQRRFHPPEKHPANPLLSSGQAPWEAMPLVFGSVRYDPMRRRYRMWYYAAQPEELVREPRLGSAKALAESDDAIHWRRPKLDVTSYTIGGKKVKTNLVFQSVTKGTAQLVPWPGENSRSAPTKAAYTSGPKLGKKCGTASPPK